MRVAIVGSGIAGLTCAHVLGDRYDVTLYEKSADLGGHANTIVVRDPEAGELGVETGFIVFNDRNYPGLEQLFAELGIESEPSEMSFGVDVASAGIAYRATSLNTLVARRSNIAKLSWWQMMVDIPRFWSLARRHLDSDDTETTIGEFVANGRFSQAFVNLHLIPMGASIWSTDPARFTDFPAQHLFKFFENHGLLGLRNRPNWKTVAAGSRRYVDAVEHRFRGVVLRNTAVDSVERLEGEVVVRAGDQMRSYEKVIFACHPDETLAVLADATPHEKEVLGAIGFQPNTATLHTDTSVMPSNRRAWAAWNFAAEANELSTGAVTVTYDLTRLQRLPGSRRYLVSLNQSAQIDPEQVIASFEYAHPVFDTEAVRAQGQLDSLQANGRILHCGAWTRYGFHEDGLQSALAVCERLGVTW